MYNLSRLCTYGQEVHRGDAIVAVLLCSFIVAGRQSLVSPVPKRLRALWLLVSAERYRNRQSSVVQAATMPTITYRYFSLIRL